MQSGSNVINNQKPYPVSSNIQQQAQQQQMQNNKLYGREGEGANFGTNSNNNLQWQGYQQQQQQPPPQIPPAGGYPGSMHQFQASNNREYEGRCRSIQP